MKCAETVVLAFPSFAEQAKSMTLFVNGVRAATVMSNPAHGQTGYYRSITLVETWDIEVFDSDDPGAGWQSTGSTREVTTVRYTEGDDYTTDPPNVLVTTTDTGLPDDTDTLSYRNGDKEDDETTFTGELNDLANALETQLAALPFDGINQLGGSGYLISSLGGSATGTMVEYKPSGFIHDAEGNDFDDIAVFLTPGGNPKMTVFYKVGSTTPEDYSQTDEVTFDGQGGFDSALPWQTLPFKEDRFYNVYIKEMVYNYTGAIFVE